MVLDSKLLGFLQNAVIQLTIDGVREIANYSCIAVNLYCVSYQLSELFLTGSSEKSRPDHKSTHVEEKKSMEDIRNLQMNPLDEFLDNLAVEKSEVV